MHFNYRSTITVAGLLLLPGAVFANDFFITPQAGIIVLLLQLIPFFHILWSKQLAVCYKTGYCMLYLSVLAISWLVVAMLDAFLPEVPAFIIRLPLLLPILFWIYTFTLGKDIRESEQSVCQMRDHSNHSD